MAVSALTTGRAAAALIGLITFVSALSGCGGVAGPEPVSATSSITSMSATESPQQRDRRIRDKLIELGCDSSACIQTYFGCRDGYITGDDCEFYRQHPLE